MINQIEYDIYNYFKYSQYFIICYAHMNMCFFGIDR